MDTDTLTAAHAAAADDAAALRVWAADPRVSADERADYRRAAQWFEHEAARYATELARVEAGR